MTVFYVETSALVKRYRREAGTSLVDELLSDPLPADRFYTSFLSVLELTSAITRLMKGGELQQKAADEILSRFRQDLRQLVRVWPLDNDIAASAVSMVLEHRLRSADAIHLATATAIFSVISGPESVLVSSDRELLNAASEARITTLDPLESGVSNRLAEIRRSGR